MNETKNNITEGEIIVRETEVELSNGREEGEDGAE